MNSPLNEERLMPPGRALEWLAKYPGQWMVLVWVPIMLAAPVIQAITTPSVGAWAFAVGIALVFAGTVIVPRSNWRQARRTGEILLIVLAGMACSSLINFGFEWIPVFALVSIGCGVALRGSGALLVIVFVTAVGTVLVATLGADIEQVLAMLVTTFFAGLGNFVVHYLASVITQLSYTRRQLALAAVDRERMRFSRDLHDLLGHTLSVIVVKAEAVRRLASTDPNAASTHAGDIEEIARRALSEVREAVGGYRHARLHAELDRATRALEDAGVSVSVVRDTGPLDEESEDLVTWIVREGATNVVRHAGAQDCSITIRQQNSALTVEVRNDGVRAAVMREGAGLAGLRERVVDAGGSLTAGPTATGFELVAHIPIGQGESKDGIR